METFSIRTINVDKTQKKHWNDSMENTDVKQL